MATPPALDLQDLARRVRNEIEHYDASPHPQQLGESLPVAWFEAGLKSMSNALVQAYWADAYDSELAIARPVAIVADDGGEYLLAFDPTPDGDFVLLYRRPERLFVSNIRGDAVGCFLSR